jgi:hypothetical protein
MIIIMQHQIKDIFYSFPNFVSTACSFLYIFQIVIRNVHIKRGLLMLVPEVIEILGGVVDELEAARVRLVSEVNKPPRGKRYVLPLLLVNTSDFTYMPSHCKV